MKGPERYRDAEQWLDRAEHFAWGDGGDVAIGAACAAIAQVHATLADSAALAAVVRVRRLHAAAHSPDGSTTRAQCGLDYPCDTIAALDGEAGES